MVSSKAKKVSEQTLFRNFIRELFKHLYSEAYSEEDTVFLSLDRAMRQLWQILRALSVEQKKVLGMQEQDFTDLYFADIEDRIGSKLFRQLYHDALDVAFDVKLGHISEFKKRNPGRPKNEKEAERILKLLQQGNSYRAVARKGLRAMPEGEAKEGRVEEEAERIRAVKRRYTRRTKQT